MTMQVRGTRQPRAVGTFFLTCLTLIQLTAAKTIPPSSPSPLTIAPTSPATELNDTATESAANGTTTSTAMTSLLSDDSLPVTARSTETTLGPWPDDYYYNYGDYNYTYNYYDYDFDSYETTTIGATTTRASDDRQNELNDTMTTQAATTDDVTTTNNESMTSPINAETSTNESVHRTPITEVMTSQTTPNVTSTLAAEADNSTPILTSYPSVVLTTVSPASAVNDTEENTPQMATARPESRTRPSRMTMSPDDAGKSPVTSTGNSTAREMAVTDTWRTLSATREYDVNGSRDFSAESGHGDAGWAAEATAEDALVVVVAVGLVGVVIVGVVYSVRACGCRARGHRKTADTEPLLGNDS